MANRYEKEVLGYSTIAVVLEDNIWEFGKPKEKAKINIPLLMPLQEPSTAVKVVEIRNPKVGPVKVRETQNYIELYLPDNLYTYPTEDNVRNANRKVLDNAKKKLGASTKISSDEKTAKKKGNKLIRMVEKDTKLVITVVDGYALEENVKILFKFDDFDENNVGVKESTNGADKKAATRSGSSVGGHGGHYTK